MIRIVIALLVATLGGSQIASIPCCDTQIHEVVCQPGIWCDIQLPADDEVDKDRPPVADESLWGVKPQVGSPAHIFVKPAAADTPRTLLNIPMHARTYHVWLVARDHTDTVVYQIAPPPPAPPQNVSVVTTPTPAPELHLYGTYRVTGRAPFTVSRIGTDGTRTFIFLPHLQSYPTAKMFDDFGREQVRTYPVHILQDLSREYILPGVWNHVELTLGGGKHTVFLRIDRVS